MKTKDDFYKEFDKRLEEVVNSDSYLRHLERLRENLWAPLIFRSKVEAQYCFSALLKEFTKAGFIDGPLAYFNLDHQFMPTDDLAAGRSFKNSYRDLLHLCRELDLNEKAKKNCKRLEKWDKITESDPLIWEKDWQGI